MVSGLQTWRAIRQRDPAYVTSNTIVKRWLQCWTLHAQLLNETVNLVAEVYQGGVMDGPGLTPPQALRVLRYPDRYSFSVSNPGAILSGFDLALALQRPEHPKRPILE